MCRLDEAGGEAEISYHTIWDFIPIRRKEDATMGGESDASSEPVLFVGRLGQRVRVRRDPGARPTMMGEMEFADRRANIEMGSAALPNLETPGGKLQDDGTGLCVALALTVT